MDQPLHRYPSSLLGFTDRLAWPRSELTPAEEAACILRRKEIWEEIAKTGGHSLATSLSDGRKSGPQHQKQFAAEVADVTGGSKSGVNQKIARARELGADIHRVVGTSLDMRKS